MAHLPLVRIVTPALAAANNGNWHTARRWQLFLAPLARVEIALDWSGEPADALIALHARRSADAIRRWHAVHGDRRLALVLTGTDLYRDIDVDPRAAGSLELASCIVVLQDEGLNRLTPAQRERARVIVQSASALAPRPRHGAYIELVAVGHLRDEKDPATMMAAVRALPASSPIRFTHIGNALDDTLAALARETAAACPRYRWIGGRRQPVTRRWIARAHALVHASKMEGGANVVIEAVQTQVPVLASRIDGNVGLLGRDYLGYFPVGDAQALAQLMQRFAAEPALRADLARQCAVRAPRFTPDAEAANVRSLVADLMR